MTEAARIAQFIADHPAVTAAIVAIASKQSPVARDARRAQDFGMVDCNRWDGWTLHPAGRDVAAAVRATP